LRLIAPDWMSWQDPLATAPLQVKVESIERYLGDGLVRFRLKEAAEQLIRDGDEESVVVHHQPIIVSANDSGERNQITTTKASYTVHADQTGSLFF
jgi:hypothetical protein